MANPFNSADVDLNKISFLRRDRAYNFAKIEKVYEEITQTNHVYDPVKVVEKNANEQFDSAARDQEKPADDNGWSTGLNEELLHTGAPSSVSSRGQFNFVCTLPYSTDEDFEHCVEKVLVMQGGEQASSESHQTTTQTSFPKTATPLRSENDGIVSSFVPYDTDGAAGSTTVSVSTTTYSEDCDIMPDHTSTPSTQAVIPTSVRTALTCSLAQQREVERWTETGKSMGESIECEQQRRLTEFTLWRHRLMRERRNDGAE